MNKRDVQVVTSRAICCWSVAVAVLGTAWAGPKFVFDFGQGLDKVKVDNYLDKLDLRVDETAGERTLTVTHKTGVGEDDTAWSVESERFPVVARQRFALRVRAYGNLSMLANVNWTKVRWFDADGKPLRTTDALGKEIDLTTPFGFRCEDMRFIETIVRGEVPAAAAAATLFVGADTPNVNGKSRISLSFVEYYEHRTDEPLEFTGDFDGPTVVGYSPSACCADFKAPIEFALSDPSGVDPVTLRCLLDGRDVTSRVKACGGDRFRYEPETDWQEGTLHEFTIEVSDRLGNRAHPDAHFSYFSTEPVAHPKYALRDDGVVLRDGRPVLPVMMCSLRKCKPNGNSLRTAVTNLLDNGFSGTHSYLTPFDKGARGEDFRELVRLADAAGLETCFEPAPRPMSPNGKDPASREKVLFGTLREGRRHRSVFAWNLGDDAADAMTVEQLKRHYRIAKAVDPHALAASTDYVGYYGRIESYLPYADVFCAELYPFRIKGSTTTSAVALAKDFYMMAIKQLKTSGRHPKSHWAVGQSFNGWGWDYYPSYEEVRLQAFLYLAMGARGLWWYTYCDGGHQWGAALDPKHWEELCRVTREVRSYEKDLVSRDALQQPRCEIVDGVRVDEAGNFPVSFLLKESGLLVAVNSSGTPVTARFTFANGKSFEHRFEYAGVLLTHETR